MFMNVIIMMWRYVRVGTSSNKLFSFLQRCNVQSYWIFYENVEPLRATVLMIYLFCTWREVCIYEQKKNIISFVRRTKYLHIHTRLNKWNTCDKWLIKECSCSICVRALVFLCSRQGVVKSSVYMCNGFKNVVRCHSCCK